MSISVSGRTLQRLSACIIGLSIISAVAAPATSPARGDGTTSVAVTAFQNEAGVDASIASALSDAAYHALSSTSGFSAAGGGPMKTAPTLTSDPFMEALHAAAKAGAQDVLTGSVVQAGGGSVTYRLVLYRVAPVTFIGSRVFTQPYPSSASALTTALSGNIASLGAPHPGSATIYSVTDGPKADVGAAQGYSVGDRFTVTRNGQRMADAMIVRIADDEGQLSISNAAPGYTPAVGDSLTSVRNLPPVSPATSQHTTFNPLGFLVAVGGVLLAIGHHGQPGLPNGVSGTPAPSSSFMVQPQPIQVNLPQATFPFLFTNTLSANSITNIPAFISYVQVNTQLPGQQATSPPQALATFCNCQVQFQNVTGPTGNPEELMTVAATNLVSQEVIYFNFFPTITDINGNTLAQPAFFATQPLLKIRHANQAMRVRPGPVAPGPSVPGSGKPGVPKVPPPKPQPPGPITPH